MADIRITPAIGAVHVTGSAEFRGTGGSSLLFITGSGGIGAGTTDPQSEFHIKGNQTRFFTLERSGTRSWDLGVNSSGTFLITDNTEAADRIAINLSGSVGIGTTNPGKILTIQPPNASDNGIRLITSAGQNLINLYQENSSEAFIRMYSANSEKIQLRANGNSYLNGGNVGIGTTNPAYKLDVAGTVFISGSTFGNPNTEGAYKLKFWDNGGTHNDTGIGVDGAGNGTEKIWFNALYGFYFNYGTGGQRITFNQNGNVGIGTTNPAEKLEVSGSISLLKHNSIASNGITHYTNNYLYVKGGTAGAALIDDGGQVGFYAQDAASAIIVTNGLDRFTISSTGATKLHAYGSGNNTGTAAYRLSVDSSGNIIEESLGAGAVDGLGSSRYIARWEDTDTLTSSSLYEDANGNIAIGNSNPLYALHVTGQRILVEADNAGVMFRTGGTNRYSVASTGGAFQIYDEVNGLNRFYITSGGNVGIGLTTPSAKLNVVGGADVLIVEGSGSTSNTTIMAVDGNNGRLFEVSDDLSDSLFSVNTIAGLPVMEAFADNVITLGAYNQYDLHITGSRVGIGTSTPNVKLTIKDTQDSSLDSGIGIIRSASSQTGYINMVGGAFNFNAPTGIPIKFRDGGTPNVTILGDGNVGIGTESPSSTLHLSAASPYIFLDDTSTSGTRPRAEIKSGDVGVIQSLLFGFNNTSGTNLLEVLVVNESGKVGVGTTAPSEKLTVEGNISASGLVYVPNIGTGTDDSVVILDSDGTLRTDEIDSRVWGTSLVDGSGTANRVAYWSDANTLTSDADFFFDGTSVGVGTTSPNARLEVNVTATGSAEAGYALRYGANQVHYWNLADQWTSRFQIGSTAGNWKWENSGGTRMVLNADGNVGVGTSSPTGKLEVSGNVKIGSTTTGVNLAQSGQDFLIQGVDVGGNAWNSIHLQADSLTGLYIEKDTNNIGIGTTAPARHLHVNDDSSYAGVQVQASASQDSFIEFISTNTVKMGIDASQDVFKVANTNFSGTGFVMDTTGKVGIGTTAPAHKLDVYENGADAIIRIHEDAGTHNARLQLRSGGNDTWLQNLPGSFEIRTESNLVSGPAPLSISTAGNVSLGYDLDVTGIITAKEFHTTFVSASIIYQSGSTKFGNSTDDTHDFTGSLSLLSNSGATGFTVARGSSLYAKINNDSTKQIFTYSTDLDFRNVNGTSRLYLSGSGNIGIGINTPSARLHVSDTSNASNAIFSTRTNGGYITLQEAGTDRVYLQWGLTYNGQSGGNYLLLTNAENGGSVSLQTKSSGGTYNSAALVVNSDGNVGIGTTGPDSPLNVYRSTATPASSTGTTLLSLQNYVGSDLSQQKTFIDFNLTDDNANFTPQVRIGAEVGRNADANAISKEGAGAFIVYTADGTDEAGAGSLTEKMRVDYAGNVGIGTINPGTRLDVWNGDLRVSGSTNEQLVLDFAASAGSYTYQSFRLNGTNKYRIFGYTSGDFGIYSDVASSYPLYINSDGNVGINTTSPSDKLHVQEGDIRIDDPNNGTVRGLYIRHSGITGNVTSLVQDTSGTPRASLRSTERSLWIQAGSAGSSPASDVRLYANQVMGLMVSSSGNVGINTTTPADKLEVSGNVRITNNSPILYFYDTDVTDLRHRILGGGNAGLEYSADIGNVTTGYHRWDIANSEKMRLTESGNLGIGTTSPNYTLEVRKDVDTWVASIHNTGSDANAQGLLVRSEATAAHDASILGVYADSGYKMMVKSTGNVGINTTAPTAKLHVRGEGATSATYAAKFTDSTGGNIMYMRDDGVVVMSNGYLYVDHADGIYSSGKVFARAGVTDDGGNLGLGGHGSVGNLTLSGSVVASFAGSVGIGSAVPDVQLDVVGNAHIYSGASSGYLNVGRNGNERITLQVNDTVNTINAVNDADSNSDHSFVLDRNFGGTGANNLVIAKAGATQVVVDTLGYVGIGTDNPTEKLHVASGNIIASGSVFVAAAYNNDHLMRLEGNSSGGVLKGRDGGVDTVMIRSYGESHFNGGNVGIGTTTPAGKLEVRTDASSNYLFTGTSTSGYTTTFHMDNTGLDIGHNSSGRSLNLKTNSADRLTITGGGNVGIGLTSPSAKLHVIGPDLGGSSGDVALTGLFYSDVGSNNSDLEIKDVRTAAGTDWTSAGKRIQMKIDSTYMGYIQFNGDSNNYGISFGTGGTTSSPGNVSQRMTISSGGTVTINNNASAGATATAFRVYGYDSDSYFRLGNNTSNSLDIELTRSDTATMFSLDGHSGLGYFAGSVGIGTTAPVSKLQVEGDIALAANGVIGQGSIYGNIGNSSFTTLKLYDSATGDTVLNNQSYDIQLNTAGGTKLIVKNGGNVGIGITNPSGKLWAQGNTSYFSSATQGVSSIVDNTASAIMVGPSATRSGIGNYTAGIGFDHLLNYGSTGTTTYSTNAGPHAWVGIRLFNTPGYEQSDLVFATRESTSAGGATLERMTVTYNGNVGIGSTAPTAKLNVVGGADVLIVEGSGSTANTTIMAVDGNNGRLFEVSDDLSDSLFSVNTIAGLPVMEAFADNTVILGAYNQCDLVVTGSKVGIGTCTPGYRLHVDNTSLATNSPALYVRNPNSSTAGVIAEFVGDSDSIQIKNVGVGDYVIYNTQQSNGIALYDGTGGVEIHYNGATVLEADSNGGIKVTGQLSATADVIAYSSDERLKENIKPIENAVDKVKQMRGVTFDWNQKSEELGFEPTTKLNDVGVIAQEVEKVFPQLIAHAPFDIDSDEEGNTISKSGEDYKTVNYSRLTAVLIEAIKEQQEQIEELKEEIKKLKG